MYYAPHILERKVVKEPDIDDNGNPMEGSGSECWELVSTCRCDDNGAGKLIGVGGEMRVYDYHVVIKGKHLIPIGTMVRVLDQDGNIRGEGEVLKPLMCNFLNYSEIWI